MSVSIFFHVPGSAMVVFLNLQGKPQLLTLDKERREKDKDMTREKGKRKRMGDLRREER